MGHHGLDYFANHDDCDCKPVGKRIRTSEEVTKDLIEQQSAALSKRAHCKERARHYEKKAKEAEKLADRLGKKISERSKRGL